jgi:O-antigen ligase
VTTSSVEARHGVDAATILTLYICLLWVIPSPMVVQALGSAGSPSNLLAIATFFWWAWFHLRREEALSTGFQPVRAAMVGWLLVMVAVYAHAMAVPIPGDEISTADSGMLRLVGMGGILLFANDGFTSLARHHLLLRRLVIAAGLVAVFGLLQYATGQLYVDRLSIPGLAAGTSGWSLAERGGFVRPSGTSTSPIEYGVVLGMMLPLMIAFTATATRRVWFYRIMLVAVIMAIFLSVSRSAYLCALVGLLVMAFAWSTKARLRALAALVAVTVVVYVSVPSLLGTILGLFSNASEDPSVASRTGSYDIAGRFIANSPVVGRGFGTFLPKYWILDNGYLGLLIEGGVVGLLGLIAVIVAGATSARRVAKVAGAHTDRELGQALLASIAAGACGLAFFDTFAFPQTAGCFFLLIGLAGSMRRLILAKDHPRPAAVTP